MTEALRLALQESFSEARAAMAQGEWATAFVWLERSHILSQRRPVRHAWSHCLMLQAGWQARDWREVAGQLPRIVAALLFSLIWVPIGNNGRARVSAFKPMPLSDELQKLLR